MFTQHLGVTCRWSDPRTMDLLSAECYRRYLINNFLLSLSISSTVNSTWRLLMVLFPFLFYSSASSFLPSNGILFTGSIISDVLYETWLKKKLSFLIAFRQCENCWKLGKKSREELEICLYFQWQVLEGGVQCYAASVTWHSCWQSFLGVSCF